MMLIKKYKYLKYFQKPHSPWHLNVLVTKQHSLQHRKAYFIVTAVVVLWLWCLEKCLTCISWMIDVAGQKKTSVSTQKSKSINGKQRSFFQVFFRKSNLSSCVVREFLSSCADNIIEMWQHYKKRIKKKEKWRGTQQTEASTAAFVTSILVHNFGWHWQTKTRRRF